MYSRQFGDAKPSRHSGRQYLYPGTLRVRYPGNSGRYRELTRNTLQGMGCACRSNGLGDSAQVQSTAQYASLGAKVGSVVPGVGTIIGGAVGAIYGAIKGKKKPTRPSKQDKANCQQVIRDYESLIAPYPNQAIGGALPEESMKAVWMCHEMVVAGTTPNPLYLEGNWLVAKDAAVEAVQKTYRAPAGTEIKLTTEGRRDRAGKLFRPVTVTWLNGEANTMNAIAAKLMEYFNKGCLSYHKAAVCDRANGGATWKHMVLDLVAWAAATQIPQVEIPASPDAALPSAAPAATPQPVVAVNPAPPPILTVPPPTAPPVPGASAPLPGAVSPVPAPPGAPPGAYEAALAAQLQPMIAQLMAQGADQKYAFTAALSSLAQRGIEPTAAVQTAVADKVQSIGGLNPWVVAGGGLATAILIFALSGRRRG